MTVLPGTETVSPGAALRSAREAAGLSVADVAAQMRLTPRQVQALEAERFDELPGAVFVRGFTRNYARVLKLDPVPLLHALEPALGQEVPLRVRETSGTLPVSARRDHSKPLLIVFGVIFLAAVGAGGYELWSRQREQWKGAAGKASVETPRAAGPAAAAEDKPQPLPANDPPASRPPPEAMPEGPTRGDAPAVREHSASDPAPQSAVDTPADPRVGRLRLQFTGQSWVEIRDRDSKVVYSGTGQPNEERVLEAQPPISVVIGNARAVLITYNDRHLDLASHAARNIARFTLE